MDSERALLRHFSKTGDAEAFSEIVQRHAGLVYRACVRVLADSDRAADATQETFLELLRRAEQITGSVSSWLHRVATRKAINMINEDTSRRRREAKYAAERALQASQWEDVSTYVDEGLDELDDEMREMLIKHFFEGRTTVSIAADKGISQPTVSRRIEAAVAELRKRLEKRGIVVAVAALGSLLAQNAVEAAPASVLKELGKIALVGAKAAGASGASSAGAVSGTGAKAATGGALAGVKAKVITAAVVAAGVVGVVTYMHGTTPVEQPERREQIGEPVSRRRPQRTIRRQKPTENAREVSGPEQAKVDAEDSQLQEEVPAYGGYRSSEPDDDESQSAVEVPAYGMGLMGGYAISGEDMPEEHEGPRRPEEPDVAPDSNKPPVPPEGD